MVTVTLDTAGSGTWNCPLGVRVIKLTVKGGGSPIPSGTTDGGGGGANIVINALSVTPGTGYGYTVGGLSSDSSWGTEFIAGGASNRIGGVASGSSLGSASSYNNGGNGGLGSVCDFGNGNGGSGSADGANGTDAGCDEGNSTEGTDAFDGSPYGNGGSGVNGRSAQPGVIIIEYEPGLLSIEMEPAGAFKGGSFNTKVSVHWGDDGSLNTSYSSDITVALLSNPGSSSLSGSTTGAPTAGYKTFTISIPDAAAGYSLRFTATDLVSLDSAAFNVSESLQFRIQTNLVRPTASTSASIAVPPLQVPVARLNNQVTASAALTVNPLRVVEQLVSQSTTLDIQIGDLKSRTQLVAPTITAGATSTAGGLRVEEQYIGSRLNVGYTQTLVAQPALAWYNGTISITLPPLNMATQIQLGLLPTSGATLAIAAMSGSIELNAPVPSTSIRLELEEITADEFPLETLNNPAVQLELEEMELTEYQLQNKTSSSVPAAKFAEAVRSSSSIVIFGSDPDQKFKLNPAATVFRRGGPQHVIHLAKAKPSFATKDVLFNLLTSFAEIENEGFNYEAPGGFLRIWNQDAIQSSIIAADTDTAEIPVTVASAIDSSLQVALSTFTVKREY